jgi:hypothetical protein
MLPRDVATRWNSTYDMSAVSCEYQPAVDAMTAKKSNELRAFELSNEEWDIARQLVKVLKVDVSLLSLVTTLTHVLL